MQNNCRNSPTMTVGSIFHWCAQCSIRQGGDATIGPPPTPPPTDSHVLCLPVHCSFSCVLLLLRGVSFILNIHSLNASKWRQIYRVNASKISKWCHVHCLNASKWRQVYCVNASKWRHVHCVYASKWRQIHWLNTIVTWVRMLMEEGIAVGDGERVKE